LKTAEEMVVEVEIICSDFRDAWLSSVKNILFITNVGGTERAASSIAAVSSDEVKRSGEKRQSAWSFVIRRYSEI
jgi:hypothetical protein